MLVDQSFNLQIFTKINKGKIFVNSIYFLQGDKVQKTNGNLIQFQEVIKEAATFLGSIFRTFLEHFGTSKQNRHKFCIFVFTPFITCSLGSLL